MRVIAIPVGNRDYPPVEPETIDSFEAAYIDLAAGVHEAVQASKEYDDPILRTVLEPVGYGNGKPSGGNRRTLIDNSRTQPEYVTNYLSVSHDVYGRLLHNSVKNDDFGLFLAMTKTYKEADWAYDFLHILDNEGINKKDIPPPTTHLRRFLGEEADAHNQYLKRVRHSAEAHAVSEATLKRNAELRRSLHDDTTGVLGALAIGLRSKMRIDGRSAMDAYFYARLQPIAELPSVPLQLVAKEKHGLIVPESTFDD